MKVRFFFPGDTRFAKTNRRSRCLWREENLMLHLLNNAVNPRLSLQECVEDWWSISKALRETPRRRNLQIEGMEK